jgi:hypothetical protein
LQPTRFTVRSTNGGGTLVEICTTPSKAAPTPAMSARPRGGWGDHFNALRDAIGGPSRFNHHRTGSVGCASLDSNRGDAGGG